MSGWLTWVVRLMSPRVTAAMSAIPVDSPSSPSIQLMLLIIPTIQKTVKPTEKGSLKRMTPSPNGLAMTLDADAEGDGAGARARAGPRAASGRAGRTGRRSRRGPPPRRRRGTGRGCRRRLQVSGIGHPAGPLVEQRRTRPRRAGTRPRRRGRRRAGWARVLTRRALGPVDDPVAQHDPPHERRQDGRRAAPRRRTRRRSGRRSLRPPR